MDRWSLAAALLVLMCTLATCARRAEVPPPAPSPPPAPRLLSFTATAYSIEGRTASGARARKGVVAADPAVLPLGSRIRVHESRGYDGEYVVRDTGPAVKGHEIDIYMANDAEAKRFGRRRVKVEIVQRGK